MHLLIATRNPSKVALFRPIFAQRGFLVSSLRDCVPGAVLPEETGATPAENALAKARAWHSPQHPWVLGDDAALEVDALGGEPGVQARRWGGRFPDDVDDETWLEYLLARLDGVPLGRRTARFVAAWALIAPDGSEHVRVTAHPFRIAERRLRPVEPGWPVSAVRIPAGDAPARDVAREWNEWGILERLLAERGQPNIDGVTTRVGGQDRGR